MAAYGALVSLMHIIKQIQHHPRPPISLGQNQVESLTENITSLQDFLEVYSHVRDDARVENIKSRISDAAHAAEDVIESHIMDQILVPSNSNDLFCQDLQRVIQDMNFLKHEVMEIGNEMLRSIPNHLRESSKPEVASSRLSPSMRQNTMVGFDDILVEIMDKLTREPDSNRRIIPIVGMGGMGKTFLAQNVYVNAHIVHYFDIRAWATVSQVVSAREILLQLLLCFRKEDSQESLSQMSDSELGEMLYKSLYGRRYLIILDDMWSIGAWESVKFFFPKENSGSGIIITSRLSKIAFDLIGGQGIEMNFLNEDTSWRLLRNIVFEEGDYPPELEETGKAIAKGCRGLPLSLVVIGGLLARSERTQEYWEYIVENLISIVNLENDAHCFNLLYLSYNHLPVHLKPCFLYFGVFREDREILVSELVKLWAAEGFLKPISGKSLEQVAEEYLRDLIDRNLVLVHKWKYNGKVKLCKIHDLLRDLCLREAEKEKFLCVIKQHDNDIIPYISNIYRGFVFLALRNLLWALFLFLLQLFSFRARKSSSKPDYRRISLHRNILEKEFLNSFQSVSDVRSFIYNSREDHVQLQDFRLLRVLKAYGRHSLEGIFSKVVNLRFASICLVGVPDYLKFPPSVYLLWNLHTLIVGDFIKTNLDIGKMPQLRHVKIWRLHLRNSSTDPMHGQGDFVLENLQTLKVVENFRCSKRMVKRIPNIKNLKISYSVRRFIGSCYCLDNLSHFQELETLSCRFSSMMEPSSRSHLLQNLAFPRSLKKLTLSGARLHWEDIRTKIGSLPFLQVLKLRENSFRGSRWETIEGQFCRLKYLEISGCDDLIYLITDDTHFPYLEQLVLVDLRRLEEIPVSIGNILTLQLIKIERCSDSVVVSAKGIQEEQEELGNEDLQVQAIIRRRNRELQTLASNNFLVQVADYYD